MQANRDGIAFAVAANPGPAAGAAEAGTFDLAGSSDDLEIGRPVSHLRSLIVAGFVMTVASASLAFGWWGDLGVFGVVAGYVGLVLFGLATGRLIWMLPNERGPVLIISRYGIRDLRIGNEFLLWDSIADVSADKRRGRDVVVLKLTPALQRQRCFMTAKGKTQVGKQQASADHIVVSPEGLATSFDTLLQTCKAFHAAGE